MRWVYWFFQTLQLDKGTNETAVLGLSRETAYGKYVSLPQQCAIAAYLDQETARLDALVAAKKRFLDLLDERRQAIITHAVTRGVNAQGIILRNSRFLNRRDWCGPAESGEEGNATVARYDKVSATARSSRIPLKYLSTINDDLLDEGTNADFEMQYVDISNVDSWGGIEQPKSYRFEEAPSRARRRVKGDDVIISTVRTYLQAIAQIQDPPDNLIVSTGFAVVRPLLDRFDARYCRFALRESTFLAEVEKRSFGVSYPAINASDLAEIPVYIHSLPQQCAIAAYLDQETARLDALVAAKKRFLDLLDERRQAIITHAVTRGVNAQGIILRNSRFLNRRDWCGPAESGEEGNATVARYDKVSATARSSRIPLKYLSTINDDLLDEGTNADFEMQYVDISNVDSWGGIEQPKSYRFEEAPSRARRRVKGDDVIISTVRTYLQAIAQIQDPPDNLIVSTGFAVVRPLLDRFDARYCRFALRESTFLAEVEKRSFGVSYPAINASDLAEIPVYIHSLPQQCAIAAYLDQETARLDALVDETRKTISLLNERRTSLISAAVTGQIDVGGATCG